MAEFERTARTADIHPSDSHALRTGRRSVQAKKRQYLASSHEEILSHHIENRDQFRNVSRVGVNRLLRFSYEDLQKRRCLPCSYGYLAAARASKNASASSLSALFVASRAAWYARRAVA